MPELGIPPERIVFITGIGCAGRFSYYMNTYGMHGIHGRAPALATGLAASRPDLSVWIVTGDGDALSIGGNHLIHALRRNVPVKILLFNNRIYGLTKGQASPTSELGKVTKSTPFGSPTRPSTRSRSRSARRRRSSRARSTATSTHLPEMLRAAAAHRGTALVEIYQNCPVFNDGAFDALTEKDQARGEPDLARPRRADPLRRRRRARRRARRRRRPARSSRRSVDAGEDALLVHDAHRERPDARLRAQPARRQAHRPRPARHLPRRRAPVHGLAAAARDAHRVVGTDAARRAPARRRHLDRGVAPRTGCASLRPPAGRRKNHRRH